MSGEVVVLGPPDDAQVTAVVAAARAAGDEVYVRRLRTDDVSRWTWSPGCLSLPDGFRLSDAAGIYLRSIPIRRPSRDQSFLDAETEGEWLAAAERQQRLHGFLKSAQLALTEHGVEVLNPLWGYAYHRSKPAADLTLAAAGIPVPRGVATSDRALVHDLIDAVGAVVYKPVAGGGRCRALDPADLDERQAALAAAPCYFQEMIPGRNLRIYTLDGEVLAAFDIEADDIDFRGRETSVEVITPEDHVARCAHDAASALGLVFAGTDIKLLPDGSHVVLDVNPSPMFAGVDPLVGGAIAKGIARRLRAHG